VSDRTSRLTQYASRITYYVLRITYCVLRIAYCVLRIKPRYLLLAILLFHAGLGALYSVTVPPWEAHDEWGHYTFARYLATERHLPPPGTRLIEKGDESHQPPLYYALVALAIAWIDLGDGLQPVPNPYSATEGGDAGVNMWVHDPATESFPYRGTILALHVARLVSVALSTLGLLATYGLGRRLFPQRPELALGATAINAFWPQYLFIGSVVTNDIMVTFCTSWFLFFFLGPLLSERSQLRDWLGMGLALGSALLSKNNGWALLPVAAVGSAIALGRMVRRQGLSLRLLRGVLAAGAGLIALTGWWYTRNVLGYGDIFGYYRGSANPFLELLAHPVSHLRQLHWEQLPAMLRYGFVTFWASFGWGNVGLAEGIYLAAGVFCILGLGGLLSFLFRSGQRRLELLLLGLTILCIVFVPMYINLGRGSHYLRGRLCLPAISPVSLLLAVGWGRLLPSRRARWAMGLPSVAMALLALILPFHSIGPVYARPPQLTAQEMQAIPHLLGITFGDSIQLAGYELGQWRVRPGERLPVTLYWQALGETEENYVLAVKVIGHDGRVYGARHLFPGRGNFATSLWKRGDRFRETYWVPVKARETTRILAHVSVSFFRSDGAQEHLLAHDPRGSPLGGSVLFGRIKVAGRPPRPSPSHEVSFQLGDRIALIGYDLPEREILAGEDVRLTLYWKAQGRIMEDYTVFVHLVSAEGELVAQGDGPPVNGSYPTGLWEGGEVIADSHIIHLPQGLPSGRYQILVGLYSPDTLVRLPVLASTGKHVRDDAIPLTYIQVSHPYHWIFLPLMGRGG